MACDNLSLGRLKPCKDSVGGLKAVYFINYGDITAIEYDVTDTDVIDSIGTSVSAYKEDHKEIKLLAHGSPHVIVEDQNGSFFLAGAVNGMDVSAGTIVTGTAMGDMSGYTLTLSGMERTPANFLSSDITAAGGTIVEGV